MNEEKAILNLKKKIFLTAYGAGAAHLASAFSVIDLLYVLYCKKIIKYDIGDPWNDGRDRLILSKGHACLALYAILNEIGMIADDELKSFCQPGSHLGGEPKLGAAPGIEASTGSLGRGLSLVADNGLIVFDDFRRDFFVGKDVMGFWLMRKLIIYAMIGVLDRDSSDADKKMRAVGGTYCEKAI